MEHIIEIETGKLRSVEADGIVSFLGIPYAEPPVGALRYKRAVPKEPWSGVLDATKYGAKSVQFFNDENQGSEDCLTINVKRPVDGDNLPVLVYIHGGGYNTGSASDPLLYGDEFVKKGIVYVTFQYRLNVLGFYDFRSYPGCEDFDSNCAVSDHILAMKWIQENIRAFGGDPDRVTISGESAGGTSVTLLMATPGAKGTFSQAISSSGIHNGVFTSEMQKKHVELLMEGMGWTENNLKDLKTIDPFIPLKGHEFGAKMHQYRYPGIFLPSPIIDDLLPDRIIESIAAGSAKGVKLVIGNNHDEGTFFVRHENTNFPNSWEMVEEMFAINGHSAAYPRVKAYYEQYSVREVNGINWSFIQLATDHAFQVPALRVAEAHRQHGEVYNYRFDFAPKKAQDVGMFASHALDLTYEFGTPDKGFGKFLHEGEDPEVIRRITEEMHMAWVDFVKTGKPAGDQWPLFEGWRSPVRVYDRETRTEVIDRTELIQVWDGLNFYTD